MVCAYNSMNYFRFSHGSYFGVLCEQVIKSEKNKDNDASTIEEDDRKLQDTSFPDTFDDEYVYHPLNFEWRIETQILRYFGLIFDLHSYVEYFSGLWWWLDLVK